MLALGYPRVPLSTDAQLIASIGEVNGVIDRYDADHPHFIVSVMPRGGFSGGPVIHEYGFLLGVYTAVLTEGADLLGGYPAVLSIEPLLNLMFENGIFPGENGRFLKALYAGSDEPFEELLKSPLVTVHGDADAMTRADHARRERIAQKRAANPRYIEPDADDI